MFALRQIDISIIDKIEVQIIETLCCVVAKIELKIIGVLCFVVYNIGLEYIETILLLAKLSDFIKCFLLESCVC